jgi:two-component system OmpR family sensor kinase
MKPRAGRRARDGREPSEPPATSEPVPHRALRDEGRFARNMRARDDLRYELARHRWRRRPRRLQRQLFLNFLLAIVATMLTTGFVGMLISGAIDTRPWLRALVVLSACMVLWKFAGALAFRLAWPLRELAEAAKEFGAGVLSRRVTVHHRAPSEVADLTSAFNDMAARIEAQVQSQRDLLGAVSHELRTPLARLRVLLALLQESGGSADLACKFEREVLEMDELVGELLAEARISAGALNKRRLDLRDVVRECLERLGLPDARVEIPAGCRSLEADPTLLSRALTILLDNARRHGGDGVSVHVEARDRLLRIAVEDDGAGFDPTDFDRLFAPFARGRGADADREGVGLGLYLVRRIAEAHGGSVFAENRTGGGACVGLTISQA